jgi:hypothetical protein
VCQRAAAKLSDRLFMGEHVGEKGAALAGGEMCVQLAEVRQERLGPEDQRAHLQPAREH